MFNLFKRNKQEDLAHLMIQKLQDPEFPAQFAKLLTDLTLVAGYQQVKESRGLDPRYREQAMHFAEEAMRKRGLM
jgi:hypothetical protein